MERLFGLLLLGSLLEAGALATESQLDNLHSLWHVLAAVRNNSLHVAAFRTDQSTSDLKLALVWDLNIITASVLGLAVA